MQSFLAIRPIKAISFDLDDTLYDNRPYIQKAEAKFLGFMQQQFPAPHLWQAAHWLATKKQLIDAHPMLGHDTWRIREVTAETLLLELGLNAQKAKQGAKRGLDHFLFHRSDFIVPESSLELLAKLKKRYPLIGISNGNVDANRIGLDEYFEFILHAGNGLRMKPESDMFDLALTRLAIKPHELLHIGDNHTADIIGARNANCQAVWLNPAYGRHQVMKLASPLPHIMITDIEQLAYLV
ncbi:MAG: HAD-IA family hydrolase [Parashewanella sp.]